MIICEFSFYLRDPDNPDYSLAEVDVYGSVPLGKGAPIHRLSLRKNLKTDKFEAYKRYQFKRLFDRPRTEVAFQSNSLEEVVAFTNRECQRFHGIGTQDQVCIHHEAEGAEFCDAPKFADSLVCFICGKAFETVGDVQDTKRLSGHLTGKHHLKGRAFYWALGYAEVTKVKARKVLRRHEI